MQEKPGLIILFGSGETSPSGRRVYDWLFSQLPQPLKVAILETPAGFQPNSALVAAKVGDFLSQHLKNYKPQITVVPARRRGAPFSTDDPSILEPVLHSDALFMGPGSPTYAIRQLRDSLTWHILLACHRLGTPLILASAASIALSTCALPVYEIYKAGEDLNWHKGLDFFGPYGLSLVFISHWNNREGGTELDTSRCYMGQDRFEQLIAILPPEVSIVGIDEHTALLIDMAEKSCHVMGHGSVTLLKQNEEHSYNQGQTFDITELGDFHDVEIETSIPPQVWERVIRTKQELVEKAGQQPSTEVMTLVRERESARVRGDWHAADELRERINAMGWQVNDTRTGPELIQSDG